MEIRKYEELDEEDIPKSVSKMKKNKHMAEEPKKRKSPTKSKKNKKEEIIEE